MPNAVITVTVGGSVVYRDGFDAKAWAEACKKHCLPVRNKADKISVPSNQLPATGPDYAKAAAELLAPATAPKPKAKKAAKK